MYLMNEEDDLEGLKWVKRFNECDLYSKSHDCPSIDTVKPYYQKVLKKYFPNDVRW